MKTGDIVMTLAGLVAAGASAAAALSIQLLLTAPMTVAGAMEGSDGPVRALARALYEALAHLVRHL